MQTVTDKFDVYINRSGRRKMTVDLQVDLAVLASDIPVISGSLNFDRKQKIRSNGSLTLAPDFDVALLEPYGTHLYIECGLVYPGGTEELVPMGRFHIEDLTYDEGTNTPTVTFYDRAKVFDDLSFTTDDWSGRWGADIVINFLRPSGFPYGDLPWEWNIVDYVLPGGSIFPGSQLDTMIEIAAGAPAFAGIPAGGEVWMDRNGGLVVGQIEPITAETTLEDAVASYAVGINLFSCERSVTRDGVYNGVLVEMAPDSNGVIPVVLAVDSDPNSRTYYNGVFGRKVKVVSMPTVTSFETAAAIANRELSKYLGLAYGVTLRAPFNPALDIGDIIAVYFFDTIELHQVDSISASFPDWVMTVTTRSVR